MCSESKGEMRIMYHQQKTEVETEEEQQVWLLGKVLDCYCGLVLSLALPQCKQGIYQQDHLALVSLVRIKTI